MAPADNPKVVGIVILDEPRGAYYGGYVAAPVFREILAAWAVQGRGPIALPPSTVVRADEGGAAEGVPDVKLLELERAREVLARHGLGVKLVSTGTRGRVASQSPEPGTAARRGTLVEVTLAAGAEDGRTIPDLRGLPLREAVARLSALAIEVGRVRGSGSVVDQSPEAGAVVPRGAKCSLVLAPRGT
jgi:hypothetical protein